MRKLATILLIILNFLLILSTVSNHFDFDLGWHLRFGQDYFTTGQFPYLDTYTFTNFGQKWVNHEWGSDILTWPFYHYLGYWPLNLLSALAILFAFCLAVKIFIKKITAIHWFAMALAICSIKHILVTRPAMYSLLFFAILWWTLEQLPHKKTYYLWPPLIWLWSCIHGSWILAFIVMGIYFAGNLFNLFCEHYFPKRILPINAWKKSTYFGVIIFGLLSLAAILINPYGAGIITEILKYFGQNYYKLKIVEWVPTYVYPIFWSTLIISGAMLVGLFNLWRQKRASWPQIFLLLAFFVAGWQYKRHMMFVALTAAPLLAGYGAWMIEKIKTSFNWNTRHWSIILKGAYLGGLLLLAILCTLYFVRVRVNDAWRDPTLLETQLLPVQAAESLKKDFTDESPKLIFNEFSWGGYLEWAVPQAKYFLDGRGTATWKMTGQSSTTLAVYFDILDHAGLNHPLFRDINYVLLEKSNIGFTPPDTFNKFIFNTKEFDKMFDATPTKLEQDLRANPHWKLIYEDKISLVWKKID